MDDLERINDSSSSSLLSNLNQSQESVKKAVLKTAGIAEAEFDQIINYLSTHQPNKNITYRISKESSSLLRSLISVADSEKRLSPGVYILCKGKGDPANLNAKGGHNRVSIAVNIETGQEIPFRSPTREESREMELFILNLINQSDCHYLMKSVVVEPYSSNIPQKISIIMEHIAPDLIDKIFNKMEDSEKNKIAFQIALALCEMNDLGIVNKDLKAENILVGDQVWIIDFGSATLYDDFNNSDIGTTPGVKPIFDSFIFVDNKTLAQAFDLWSFGVILSQLYFNGQINRLNEEFDIRLLDEPPEIIKAEYVIRRNKILSSYENRQPDKTVVIQMIRELLELDPVKRIEPVEEESKRDHIAKTLKTLPHATDPLKAPSQDDK